MYRPTTSTTSNHNFSNGHLSADSTDFNTAGHVTSESESDLSDAVDAPNNPPPSSHPEDQELEQSSQDQNPNTESSSSHEEDAIGSDDADYDMETPPPVEQNVIPDETSSSEDSRSHNKRKASVDQDDYMTSNPELYGLRRSVRSLLTIIKQALINDI